jgi:hypothetical protein
LPGSAAQPSPGLLVQASACSAQSAWPHTVATDLQELPPDAKCPTAKHVATQLGLNLATIHAKSKLFHIIPLFALIPSGGFGCLGGVFGPTHRVPKMARFECVFSTSFTCLDKNFDV